MHINEFREHAHRLVDWMADYLQDVGTYPVKARVAPGDIAKRIPLTPPGTPESVETVFDDFRDIVIPGMTHWQHPSFFAYFPANSSPASILGEMLTATLGAQCMSWETSPAATELETVMLDWIRGMIGLPEDFVGSIQDTASTATLVAVLAARERATGFSYNETGQSGGTPLCTYCSAEANSSVEKAVKIAGLGRRHLRKIRVDGKAAMDPTALYDAVARDVEAGFKPTCIIACLGTTGCSGVDPLRAIAEVAQTFGVWLHVDAAWAGSALILPEYRWMIDGIEQVDSFVFNPHKWLFTNFDCSAFYVRDPDTLLRTLELTPDYLRTRVDDQVTNYRDWGIQLGRRFRGLKLWFVLRTFGVRGLQERVRYHIEMAQELATKIEDAPDFELVMAPTLSLLCFRYRPDGLSGGELDVLNERLLHRLNDSGRLYVTHTRWQDNYVIRFVVGQTNTEREHVDAAWTEIQRVARGLD
jgi:aromatic-L-amino-acid/L-tryptophan decarboxylase